MGTCTRQIAKSWFVNDTVIESIPGLNASAEKQQTP